MTNGAVRAYERDAAPARAACGGASRANGRESRAAGGGCPREELDGTRDPRLGGPLPAPVELGLGVHRDRLLGLGPGAGASRAQVDLRRAVGRRAAAPHPVRRRRALLPRARVLAD